MKKTILFIIMAVFAVSCGNNRSVNNKANEPVIVDMGGTFKGTLPAADCSGIEYILKLEPQGTYKLQTTYIDGEGDGIDIIFTSEGRVVRVSREDGEYLRLLPPPGNDTVYFKTIAKDKLRLVSHLSNEPGALAPEHYEIIKEK